MLISKVTPELLASLCLWDERGLPVKEKIIWFDTSQMVAYVREETDLGRRIYYVTKFLFLGGKELELFVPLSLRDYLVDHLE